MHSAGKRGRYARDAKSSAAKEDGKDRGRKAGRPCKHEEESMFANKVVIPGHPLFSRYHDGEPVGEQVARRKWNGSNLMNFNARQYLRTVHFN